MRVIVNGACGQMGQEITRQVKAGVRGAELAAMIDMRADQPEVLASLDDFAGQADIIIDFSFHTGVGALLDYAVRRMLPVVICTTGHTEEEEAMIRRASESIPIFHSANMSIGVALLVLLAKQAAAVFKDADIEIVETHHKRKKDAPSGTALMIANAIREVRNDAPYKLGRAGHDPRNEGEIGIHAVRMGNIVGTHEVMLSTETETITLKHEAHSRALFADGALAAAEYLVKQQAGFYDMYDMID